MNHHAYYIAGAEGEGITHALEFGERVLGLAPTGNPDVTVLPFQLFSVEEARKVHDLVHRMPVRGDKKLIVISAQRLFHETQNALLKVFEEPPEGTTLILIVPSIGVLIPTLRSRLIALPYTPHTTNGAEVARSFLKASLQEREKIVGKLLDKAKSDTQDEKQQARSDALAFAVGLTTVLYEKRQNEDIRACLADLNRFIPILHERSAPLKLIFEHLLLTIPQRIS